MIPTFEELDYQQTPMGDLILRRRRVPTLDDQEVFEVKLGEEYLMSSLFPVAEIALADLGLAEVEAAELDVVVGGLGLGYTAATTLAHPRVRSLLVVEMLDAVIGWHRRGLVPLGATLAADERCRLLQGDFFALATAATGFDAGCRFHAVLLDIDHTPRFFLHERHGKFYSTAGLRALSGHLLPGGVFGMWSDDPPDTDFVALLATVFINVRAEIISFPNPLTGGQSSNTVYLGRTASA